ncbi:MAG: thioesterase [Gammaproteobacteria bacterium]|nr:thioesterase [Gammaproteobacteria bacterium]
MTTLKLHSEPLQDSWLDNYGHLNEAYYLVPFTNTTWKFQDNFGIGIDYFNATGCALYTVETHLRYLNEVRSPALIEVETIVLGSDPKKIWFAHLMMVDNNLCATAEFMTLHYSTRDSRTAPLPEATQQALQQAELDEMPDWIGRQISLVKK